MLVFAVQLPVFPSALVASSPTIRPVPLGILDTAGCEHSPAVNWSTPKQTTLANERARTANADGICEMTRQDEFG